MIQVIKLMNILSFIARHPLNAGNIIRAMIKAFV